MTTKPTLIAYAVKNRGKNQKAIWTRIGAAWPHSAGEGLSIELDVFTTDAEDPRLTADNAELFEGAAAEEIVPEPGTLRSFINWLRLATARRPKVPH
jgi:hypothetical protein